MSKNKQAEYCNRCQLVSFKSFGAYCESKGIPCHLVKKLCKGKSIYEDSEIRQEAGDIINEIKESRGGEL